MPTNTYYIGQGSDDGFVTDANAVDTSSNAVYIGDNGPPQNAAWFSFRNIPIAAGTITNAVLSLTVAVCPSNVFIITKGAARSTVPATPTLYSDISGASFTTANRSDSLGFHSTGAVVTFDVTSIVNEIINAGYWSSGGCITLYMLNTASFTQASWYSYEFGHLYSSLLITGSGVPGTIAYPAALFF